MSTKSRQSIYGGPLMGAKIRAEGARKRAAEAGREADRAEAEAWSLQMEAYRGPAQPSPTIGQCINGGLGWLEVECKRCKTRGSLPLDAIPQIAQARAERQRGAENGVVARPAVGRVVRSHCRAKPGGRDFFGLGSDRIQDKTSLFARI